MGEMDLQEEIYNGKIRKWVLQNKHNIEYESLEVYYLHHLLVIEFFDKTTLSISDPGGSKTFTKGPRRSIMLTEV
jgi:hypothetical protein